MRPDGFLTFNCVKSRPLAGTAFKGLFTFLVAYSFAKIEISISVIVITDARACCERITKAVG